MVLTNTYQATVDGFMKHMNLSKEKSVELIKLGVKICKEAVGLEQGKGSSVVKLEDTYMQAQNNSISVYIVAPSLLSSPHPSPLALIN